MECLDFFWGDFAFAVPEHSYVLSPGVESE